MYEVLSMSEDKRMRKWMIGFQRKEEVEEEVLI